MKDKNDGGSAFPMSGVDGNNDPWDIIGMTLRDYFAAHTISPMLVQAYGNRPDVLAQKAYEIADAMIEERAAEVDRLKKELENVQDKGCPECYRNRLEAWAQQEQKSNT